MTKRLILLISLLLIACLAYAQEEKRYFFTNFTTGAITRKLDARLDFEKFFTGARVLENLIVYPYGGIFKRPGMKYVSGVSVHSKKVRLIPFEFNTEQAYVIEMGNLYARFYMDHGQIQSIDSSTKLLLHANEIDASTVLPITALQDLQRLRRTVMLKSILYGRSSALVRRY